MLSTTSRVLGKVPKLSTISSRWVSTKLNVVSYDNESISIKFKNGKVTKFNNVFIRDSCRHPESVEPFSKQKLFTTVEIAKNLKIDNVPYTKVKENSEVLVVEWDQNGKSHTSEISEQFLTPYTQIGGHRKEKFFDKDVLLWDRELLLNNLDNIWTDYSSYIKEDNEQFYHSVSNLNKFGLTFIKNIPQVANRSEKMTEENHLSWPISNLASKFGYIKKTFYGSLFEVKNEKENAKNIANTDTFLPLHMDLLYYESPPGLQLLHFIKNSTLGGENVFCDSFLAAEHVRNIDPDAYYALTKVPVTYWYDNNNEYYFYKRPVIIEDEDLKFPNSKRPHILAVNYAPPFQGPFEYGVSISEGSDIEQADDLAKSKLFKDFLRGFTIFEEFINDPLNHFEIKMPENTCVIFQNRRVLHSRKSFSAANGGDRWLMGCYIDGDSFRSKLRTLSRKFK
ncbi:gamma-butyrobetaine dioxygenase [Scheffersomyces amazonensis]|uniref:gamma-butyrobetaine dioxygenase n=1 Tax=Scheffersomyces amazonensis TaxID=1078765 RepID=UPI00315DF22C